jgi:phosphatidylglycerophosphatase C
MSGRTLVLFDFDGTISTSDTFPLFIHFFYGSSAYTKSILISPVFLAYLLKLISAEKAKRWILKYFFGGHSKEELFLRGKEFIDHLHEQQKIKPEMIQKINSYRKDKAEIAVVSASPDIWIDAFCEKYQLQSICTRLEFKKETFTGNFETPNCNKEEKKKRILEKYKLSDFENVIAYGNSSGDDAMLSLAHRAIRV